MKKLFQAGLGQFLGGAAAPQHLQTSRPCSGQRPPKINRSVIEEGTQRSILTFLSDFANARCMKQRWNRSSEPAGQAGRNTGQILLAT